MISDRILCIVPRDLAAKLHEPLRRFFTADSGVEVVIERREGDRRMVAERRVGPVVTPPAGDQRRVLNQSGRRVDERRGMAIRTVPPTLPRRARQFSDRLVFIQLSDDTSQWSEDAVSDRLVAQFQAGDQQAFAELYMRYFNRVYAYLYVVFRDPGEAEDATQAVFLSAFEALPRYEFRGRPFRAWLFVVVRNHALRRLAERGRVDLTDPSDLTSRNRAELVHHDRVDEALEWLSDRELVMLIERLPFTQRQVLLLRFLLDLSAGETAAVLGLTPENVRQLQARALAFLRKRLQSLGRTPARGGYERAHRRIRPVVVTRARRFALQRW